MSFGDFHFLRPSWLVLLPVAILVWWIRRRADDPLLGWRSLINSELLAALQTSDQRSSSNHYGMLAGWILGVLAIAGPTWRLEPSPFADDPVPVVIVMRAAESMNNNDLSPSRLERAKLKIDDFAKLRDGQPMGLVAYSGSSHLVLPPTRDTKVVAEMANEISPDIMPRPGDDLLSALQTANRSFGDQVGSIVLVVDTIEPSSESALREFHQQNSAPVEILAIGRKNTPEVDAIQQASDGEAKVTLMTADETDVEALVRRTARLPSSVSAENGEARWAEAGWWLVPIIAFLSLANFRKASISIDGDDS